MYDKTKTQLRSHVHNRIALLEAQVCRIEWLQTTCKLIYEQLLAATEKYNKATFDRGAAAKAGQATESIDKELKTLENRQVYTSKRKFIEENIFVIHSSSFILVSSDFVTLTFFIQI